MIPDSENIINELPSGFYYNGAPCKVLGEVSETEVKIKYLNESGRAYYRKIVKKTQILEVK